MSKYLLLLLLAGCATEIKKESTVKQVTCVGFCSVTEIDENIEIDESIERAEDMMLENTQEEKLTDG